ncbi:tetratricopeptide repeat protein [Actibacterium sp. XHP0104]|uniref:tetratricopeptide repeat protein n=1 Tax=Actibacterium sp. XHP0104 TaxID=2984335 RepID=UPI0039924CE8
MIRTLGTAALAGLVAGAVPAVGQEGVSGPYLAARSASYMSDYEAASQYYTQALTRDPGNALLLENALLAFTGLGEVAKAQTVARRMAQLDPENQTARMLLLAEAIGREDYAAVLGRIEQGDGVGPLVDGLVGAWAAFGEGRMSDALTAFDDATGDAALRVFGTYHKILALAGAGDFEGARDLFTEGGRGLRISRRGVLAEVQILSQLDENEAAVAVLDEVFGFDLDPGLADLRARLVAGETVPFTTVRNARDGAAEVFYTVAGALKGEANDTYTLLYSRIAEHLRPDHVDAILLSADLLEAQEQHDLATAAYLRVPAGDPGHFAAELGRAGALEKAGRDEAALEVLTQLSKTMEAVPLAHVSLGDMLSRQEDFDGAIKAYDKALAQIEEPERAHWIVFYARGIAYERTDDWERAEADFRKALELEPDQPRVLNYLGYSLVEKRRNLDEALDMIQRAVAARPDSGYIVDSLGWVYYRLGRYAEAVEPMERAVELVPIDPVVNDHLGDVLWAVGRRVEAEFQWRRALSFIDFDNIPQDVDPDRIRRKLEVGLDKVLEEEGADPISVANGD